MADAQAATPTTQMQPPTWYPMKDNRKFLANTLPQPMACAEIVGGNVVMVTGHPINIIPAKRNSDDEDD